MNGGYNLKINFRTTEIVLQSTYNEIVVYENRMPFTGKNAPCMDLLHRQGFSKLIISTIFFWGIPSAVSLLQPSANLDSIIQHTKNWALTWIAFQCK